MLGSHPGARLRFLTYVLRACRPVAIDRQLQTFADMAGVNRLGGKLHPDSLEPQQHFFADYVDETHLRQIYDQVRWNDGASDQRSCVRRILGRTGLPIASLCRPEVRRIAFAASCSPFVPGASQPLIALCCRWRARLQVPQAIETTGERSHALPMSSPLAGIAAILAKPGIMLDLGLRKVKWFEMLFKNIG